MKIYTRKGDTGSTGLIGGTRVSKSHLRIDAYGTVHELNAHIGMLRDQKIAEDHKKLLLEIQDRLFTMGSLLASDPEKSNMQLPQLNDGDIDLLEQTMDRLNASLPELRSFVLPGGHPTVSQCHIARCVCRRAERAAVQLHETATVDERIIRYLNRLSDYLFVLGRALSQELGATETPWNPRQ